MEKYTILNELILLLEKSKQTMGSGRDKSKLD